MKWLIAYIKLILLGLNGERRIDPPLLRNIRYYPLSLNIFTCVLIYKKIKLLQCDNVDDVGSDLCVSRLI